MSGLRDPNPTVTDLKQLAWAWLVLLPFIALASSSVRHLLGWRAALWLGVGVAGFAAGVLLLVVVASLAVSYAYEWIAKHRADAQN